MLARFRLLMGLADEVDGAGGPEELVEAALDLLVPGMGDVAIVDAVLLGEHRRLGVRGGPGIETATLEAIRRRRWQPAADARLPEDAIAIAGLQAGGQVLGTLTLADSEPFRRFDAEDRALADELGRRAGVALLNARMYQRRTAIAQAL